MSFITGVLTGLAAVSLPVMYAAERKYGSRKLRRIHGIMLLAGILYLAALCIVFGVKVSSAAEGIAGWAEDFFCSCFTPITVAVSSISALLSVAAAIRHPMRRIRMTIAMLIPIAVIAATLFMAYLATGGYFAVDVYIRGAAPGLALIPHAVPLCERTEK